MVQTLRKLMLAAGACVLAAGVAGGWLLVAARPAARGPRARPDATGGIQGKVNFEGVKPKREIADLEMADPVCVAAHVFATANGETRVEPIYEEDGAVNANGTLPNVFLFVKDGLTQTFQPPHEPAVLDQRACVYVPHVLGIMVGQDLKVLSSDATIHNVHILAKVNKDWNASQAPGGPPLIHRFTKPEIMIPVSCNKHPWMGAYIGVTTNPFYAVTGKDGTFTIKGLPPGTYTLAAWTATFGTKEQSVKVQAGEAAQADFVFTGK